MVEWKVENREGKGGRGARGREGKGREGTVWVLFPPMFLSQLCNEGKMYAGSRADQEGGHCLSGGK